MTFYMNQYDLGATLGMVASTRPERWALGTRAQGPLHGPLGPLALTHLARLPGAPLCGGGAKRRLPYEACWRPRQGKARQTARQDQLSRAKAKQARQPTQISKGQGSQRAHARAQKTSGEGK